MAMAASAVLLLAASSVTAFVVLPSPAARHIAPRVAPPLLSAAGDRLAPLQELPTPALLKAIAKCGSSGTAADVAAAAGLEISEARRQVIRPLNPSKPPCPPPSPCPDLLIPVRSPLLFSSLLGRLL